MTLREEEPLMLVSSVCKISYLQGTNISMNTILVIFKWKWKKWRSFIFDVWKQVASVGFSVASILGRESAMIWAHSWAFAQTCALVSLGQVPTCEMAGSHGRYMFSALKQIPKCCFQSGGYIVHSHQPRMRVPVPPAPHQHLAWSVFLILVILTGVWYFLCGFFPTNKYNL